MKLSVEDVEVVYTAVLFLEKSMNKDIRNDFIHQYGEKNYKKLLELAHRIRKGGS